MKLRQLFFGKSIDPLDKKARQHIALTAFLAWVGIGADGLSSSCYGPAQAFLALGQHNQLALFLSILIIFTVFVISFAYNQVISLFPNGGGGYKVATELLGSKPGLIAGSALLVDYMLTIVISIASGADALFSLLPMHYHTYKLHFEGLVLGVLVYINLRGMKEAITVLLPIFLGFVFTHVFMIGYGILRHGPQLPNLINNAIDESFNIAHYNGLFFAIALFLHAYSMGGGTYTGLEAVSNNVNMLQEPRVRTGKWTMFFMAVSLSLTAGGLMMLYLLWEVAPIEGQTLNAIAFRSLLFDWHSGGAIVTITLLFEFGLLFVGANTGFIGGPAVLSNMAMHQWVPSKFRNLSSRLVAQNGIIVFGLAAYALLVLSKGYVGFLIILYAANVFLAFSMSILGLCKHWVMNRPQGWVASFSLAVVAFIICSGILAFIVIGQFFHGGFESMVLTFSVVALCLYVKRHYQRINKELIEIDKTLVDIKLEKSDHLPEFDNHAKTAVFFVTKSRGIGIHTIQWVLRLFPNIFKNFIFVSVGEVDVESYGGEKNLALMEARVQMLLSYFTRYSNSLGFPVMTYSAYGTQPVDEAVAIVEKIIKDVPNSVFFASQLILNNENWLKRQLHNNSAFDLQRRLSELGQRMMIIPMNL
ncbi:APC family permease [Legionella sp. W05-934-2]|uniref:APC family permease n=1 Tax=Legionella sp. W05-934-2 TaxID=1198649 RepID=UPI003463593D